MGGWLHRWGWVMTLWSMARCAQTPRYCCQGRIMKDDRNPCPDGAALSLTCPNSSIIILHEGADYQIESNRLVVKNSFAETEQVISSEEFCIGVYNLSRNEDERVAAVCFAALFGEDITGAEEKHLSHSLFSYLLLVSVLFLGATLGVYGALPGLRDPAGRCLMCFVASLALGYLSLFVLHRNIVNYYESPRIVCKLFGYWTYFWLLSSFTWLFLISFNIWYHSKFVVTPISEKSLWLLYLSFGYGIPAVYQVVAVISQHLPGIFIQHNIGAGVCWFQGRLEIWVYFSGPMAVVLLFNVVFFILTTRILWVNYKEVRPQSRIRRLRFRMALHLKLFLAMGLTWIFELLSFAFSIDLIVADVLNSLQGPIIFIIMVLTRRKVMKALISSNCFTYLCSPCSKTWDQQHTQDDTSTVESTGIQLN